MLFFFLLLPISPPPIIPPLLVALQNLVLGEKHAGDNAPLGSSLLYGAVAADGDSKDEEANRSEQGPEDYFGVGPVKLGGLLSNDVGRGRGCEFCGWDKGARGEGEGECVVRGKVLTYFFHLMCSKGKEVFFCSNARRISLPTAHVDSPIERAKWNDTYNCCATKVNRECTESTYDFLPHDWVGAPRSILHNGPGSPTPVGDGVS